MVFRPVGAFGIGGLLITEIHRKIKAFLMFMDREPMIVMAGELCQQLRSL